MAAVLSLAVGASDAMPAKSDTITISMLVSNMSQPGFNVLIPNFERVYPNIKVNVTYALPAIGPQLESTELGAGNAPDLLATIPGRATPTSVYELARAGDLAPLVKESWTRRSLPLVTSLSKVGGGLYTFETTVIPFGVFTNNALFSKLGLKVPQTFAQLLTLCQTAKADGTAALLFDGASSIAVTFLLGDLAVATLYGKDKQWTGELKAGKVTFDGTSGWHQALQEFVDMNNAGCFQPGVTGTSAASEDAQFAQGQGLMEAGSSNHAGTINAASPQFAYSFDPFPGGTAPGQSTTAVYFQSALAINAHSSAQNQAAAHTFIDFVARPKQDALFAQLTGGLTQYELLKGQLPAYMSAFAKVFNGHEYYVDPPSTWWNASVELALQHYQIGLITGQASIDDVLNAMDAAWKQGPS